MKKLYLPQCMEKFLKKTKTIKTSGCYEYSNLFLPITTHTVNSYTPGEVELIYVDDTKFFNSEQPFEKDFKIKELENKLKEFETLKESIKNIKGVLG